MSLTKFYSQITTFFKKASTTGLHLPVAHNAVTGKPSVTLFFAYFTFILAFLSVCALHFWFDMLPATLTSLLFWAVAVIFYRIGKLDKAKIDFNDQSIELNNDESETNEDKEPNE